MSLDHRLRETLVWDPRTERLYHHSPEFRAGIEQLVRMLPKWVQLMADDAEKIEERRYLMTERLDRLPYPVPFPRD